MSHLFLILILLMAGWFWLDSLRAKELATGICRAACQRQGLQLLDQTVALQQLRLRRTFAGLRLRRVYLFDFSDEGAGRHRGYLVLLGLDLEDLGFGLPQAPGDD